MDKLTHIFNDVFCTYTDLKKKSNSIINIINNINFLKHPDKKLIISNESARECELYKEFADKNQDKVPQQLKKYGLNSKLNKYIAYLFDTYSPFYELAYELGNYRKHVAYDIPTYVIDGKSIFVATTKLLSKDVSSKCKRLIKSNQLLMANKLLLSHLIKMIGIYSKKQIYYLAENSFLSFNYLNNFYINTLRPIHTGKIGVPARLIKTSKGWGFESPFDEDNFIVLVEEFNQLGLTNIKISKGYMTPE